MALDPEKIKKIWNTIKTIIEIILAALAGGLVSTTANAAGLYSLLS